MSQVDRAPLDRAQRIAAEVLATVERPIVINGAAFVQWPCCEAPAHALAWAAAEVKVAARMWAAMIEAGLVDARWGEAPTRRFACPVCFRGSWGARQAGRAAARRPHPHHGSGRCPVCGGARLATPATCDGVVAMATALASGVADAVEDEVRALARALAPWGADEATTMIWRLRERPRGATPPPLRRAAAAAAVATRPSGGPPRTLTRDDDRRAVWRAAVAAGVRLPRALQEAAWSGVETFAALPDPFATLDAITRLGAAIEAMRDDGAVIGWPTVTLAGERFADLLVIEDRGRRRAAAAPRS